MLTNTFKPGLCEFQRRRALISAHFAHSLQGKNGLRRLVTTSLVQTEAASQSQCVIRSLSQLFQGVHGMFKMADAGTSLILLAVKKGQAFYSGQTSNKTELYI